MPRRWALMDARPFKSWEDVAAVEGMSFDMIDDLRSGGGELG